MLLIGEAWPYWADGDKAKYWETIAGHLADRIDDVDAIVLAQASMAGAAELLAGLHTPVFSSPKMGVTAAIAIA